MPIVLGNFSLPTANLVDTFDETPDLGGNIGRERTMLMVQRFENKA